MPDFAIVGFCERTRQFGIGAIGRQFGGAGSRLAIRAWRGLVYAQGGPDLPSTRRAESLLEEGWRGAPLLEAIVEAGDMPDMLLVTIDADGRAEVRCGSRAQRESCRATAENVCAVSTGLASAAAAQQMRDTFIASADQPLPERLMRALESIGADTSGSLLSGFLRVHDPSIEYAYTDVTVDLADQPVVALREAHDVLSPLYDYYAVRGRNPLVPRYPQWLAARGVAAR